MVLDTKVAEHEEAIRELQRTVIILQRDQENLKQYVTEMKDDFKGELQQTESRLQQAFSTLRTEVVDTFRAARASVPIWASVGIAALGVLVGIVSLFRHGW